CMVDSGDGGSGAVEDHDVVIVAGGEDVVADGEGALAAGHVVTEPTGGAEPLAGPAVEVVDVAVADGDHEMAAAGLAGGPPVVDELFPDVVGGIGLVESVVGLVGGEGDVGVAVA